MVNIDKIPGRFKIALVMYFDDINQNVGGAPDSDALIYVYRKSDNKRITSFYIPVSSHQSINYTNQACATIRRIKTSIFRYEGIVNWNPLNYDDPSGYYLTWQYCCRNGDIDNINEPSLTGETFYLEFPALSQTGKPFINSSPVFSQVDGEYLCLNEPFQFSFDAEDADGDQLIYSFDTPFDRLDPQLGVGSKNGLNIRWLSGFGADKAIPGNPPLSINRETGELTVTPNRLGLFVFTVVVEEYRNGKKIGLVRRDYQLFVVDCPPTAPPDPTVTLNNQLLDEIQVCEGKIVDLTATSNPNWDYQWKKDGKNIPGAVNPTLSVTESGTYQLVTSLKEQCSKTRRSGTIKVTVTKSRFKLKAQDPLHICGTFGQVRLSAFTGTALIYQWYFDGKLLPDSDFTLVAKQPGQYWAIVRDYLQGCTSYSDTLKLNKVEVPVVSITTLGATTAICAGDSLLLKTPSQSNYQYQWLLDGAVISGATASTLVAHRTGNYTASITDTTSCQVTTAPLMLTVVSQIAVSLDSIPKRCGLSGTVITLKGSPAGGFYTGPGVTGNTFDPAKVGAGRYTLSYTIKSDLACQQGIAQQVAVVSDPNVRLIPAREVSEICADDSLVLSARTPPNTTNYLYTWTLDDQAISGKEKIAVRQAGTYQVSIIDVDGCTAQSQPYSFSIAPTIRVLMDSVPVLCGIEHPPITLTGHPAGGIFSGPGVTANQYDPFKAGVGRHVLTYTVNSPFACQNGTATRLGIIQALPAVELGPDLTTWRGGSVQLQSSLTGNYSYQWEPPNALSSPTIAAPKANPDQTTSYTLTVTDSYGCAASDTVRINVYERIWIPDAFTPNGDGINDSWELRGIENYPEAEITIFNRWGEIIFFSRQYKQPFDGKFQNTPLPTGVYVYQIKPSSTQTILQGSLTLVR